MNPIEQVGEVMWEIGSEIGALTLKSVAQKREKLGPDFGQLYDFTANNFRMEQDIVSRKSVWKIYRVVQKNEATLHFPKYLENYWR